MALTLLDAVASWHLQRAGLPTITSLPSDQGSPATDAYLANASEVQTFSGYGQLMSALTSFSSALSGANAELDYKQVTSSDESVALALIGANASSQTSYSVSVSQLAQGGVVKSSYRAAAPTTQTLSNGTFSIQLGAYDRGTSTFEGAGDAVTITTTDSSLNGIRDAINAAGAGVTAAVGSDANGYYLTVSADTTGANSYVQLDAAEDSLFSNSITSLGFQETQIAQDASFVVDGSSKTSATNQASIGTDTTIVLEGTGSATITVSSTLGQSITDVSGVTTAAQNLANSYNTLMGRINTLNTGQLSGNADLSTIAAALASASTATYGVLSINDITDVGITSSTPDTLGNFLTINTTTLASAFSSSPTGTVGLLGNLKSAFQSLIGGYADPDQSVLSGLTTTIFSGYDTTGVPAWVKNAVLAYELNANL